MSLMDADLSCRHGATGCHRIVGIAFAGQSLTDMKFSDYTGSQTKLPKILLNGNNICMVCDWPLSYSVRRTHSHSAYTRWLE